MSHHAATIIRMVNVPLEPLPAQKRLSAHRSVQDNMAALRSLRDGTATPEILSRWHGWGAAPAIFTGKAPFSAEHAELREMLTAAEWESASKTTLNAHYTDPGIIQAMWDAVPASHHGPTVEPGCGRGSFITLAPEGADVTGWELDPTTARICRERVDSRHTIMEGGFHEGRMTSGSAMLAIGNVPFGDFKLHDPDDNPGRKHPIHSHFILKSLRALAPGGLAFLITSRYFLDSSNPAARMAANSMAEFLGAVRLPADAHEAEAGCTVVTDVVAFRRRDEDLLAGDSGHPEWLDTVPISKGAGLRENKWVAANPYFVLGVSSVTSGQFGPALTVKNGEFDPCVIRERLDELVNGPRWSEMTPAETPEVNGKTIAQTEEVSAVPDGIPGDHRLNAAGEPEVYDLYDGWKVAGKAGSELAGLVRLGVTARAVVDADAAGTPDETLRGNLAAAYKAYTSEFGPLNRTKVGRSGKRTAPKLGGYRTDPRWPLVSALESFDHATGTVEPAAILSRPVIGATRPVSAETDHEALLHAISTEGALDPETIGRLRGKPAEDVMASLEAEGHVFCDPDGKWVHQSEYLSGDILAKLAAVDKLPETDPRRRPYRAALEAVLPAPATSEQILGSFGAAWVPLDMVDTFANTRLANVTPQAYRKNGTKAVHVTRTDESGWTVISGRGENWTFQTADVKYPRLLGSALNGRGHTVRKEIDGKTYVDLDATAAANDMIELMHEEWDRWLLEDSSREAALIDTYSRLYCAWVPRDYSTTPVHPVGTNVDYTLRPSQINAITRIVLGGDTLLAHPVGAGKTDVLAAAGMELKRLGRTQLPCYVVPNHIVSQFASMMVNLYPQIRLLTIDKGDISPKSRELLAAKVATGDWDAVLISHETFRRWPLSIEAQQRMAAARIADLTWTIAEMATGDNKAETSDVKRLETKLTKAQEKAKELTAKLAEGTDEHAFPFDASGISMVLFDEAQALKNYPTDSCANVAGIATAESQRSVDAMDKVTVLRERYPSQPVVVLSTGTPVSNTVGELWVMARYVTPDSLKRLKLWSFDSFREFFALTVAGMELGRDGTMAAKDRLAQYKQLPRLARWMSEWMDRVDIETLGLERPKLDGGERIIVEIEPHPDLVEYISGEAVRRAIALKNGGVDPKVDNHLKLDYDVTARSTDWARFAETPFTQQELEDHCLIYRTAMNVAAEWAENRNNQYVTAKGNPHPVLGGTHIVFSDAGTPKPDDPSTAYERLRTYLVALGVPYDEIGFIHEHDKTDDSKEAFFEQIRNGEITVAVASTSKMGSGTNVQTRLCSEHHMTCPHRPVDLEQREGRIERQGNQNRIVRIYVPMVVRTGSVQQWQRVRRKAGFIRQLMASSIDGQETTDRDDPELVGYSALREAATGDEDFALQAELDGEVIRLERLQRQHEMSIRSARVAVRDLEDASRRADAAGSVARQFVQTFGEYPGASAWTIDGRKVTAAEVADRVNEMGHAYGDVACLHFENTPTVGHISLGHRGRLTIHVDGENPSWGTPGRHYRKYVAEMPVGLDNTGANEMVDAVRVGIQKAASHLAKIRDRVAGYERSIEANESAAKAGFRHAKMLANLRLDLDVVNTRLRVRYMKPEDGRNLRALFGERPPDDPNLARLWRNLMKQAADRPALVSRWQAIRDGKETDSDASNDTLDSAARTLFAQTVPA